MIIYVGNLEYYSTEHIQQRFWSLVYHHLVGMSTKWDIFAYGSDVHRQGSRVVCGIVSQIDMKFSIQSQGISAFTN